MQNMSGIMRQPIVVEEDAELSGMCSADVTVRAGCYLLLSGMVSGDVILEQGARVNVTGQLSGSIHRR
jgi:hypothetical protein